MSLMNGEKEKNSLVPLKCLSMLVTPDLDMNTEN